MAGTARTLTGKVLSVTYNGTSLPARKGTCTRKVESIDTTAAGVPATNGYMDKEAGLKSASGNFECICPVGATPAMTEGDLADVVVAATGGRTVTVSALITQVEDNIDYKGEYVITGQFESRGQYTVS